MSLTINESGQAIAETQDGVTMPINCSFKMVNDWIHGTDVHFEDVQALCLGMANENDRLREALNNIIAANCGHFADTDSKAALFREITKAERILGISTETESTTGNQRSVTQEQHTVIPRVIGRVSYDVKVECPHCKSRLQLNEYPYNDEETDYSLAEDEIGAALFGHTDKPANLEGLDIEYQCCGCHGKFSVSGFEI